MAGNIQEFDAGNLKLNPTEVGVEARAGTARRIGMFFNQQASGEEMLARETSRLAGETQQLGRQTETLGSEKGAAMADTGRRIGSSIADAGSAAVQYLEHKDISQGAPAYARVLAQKTNEWNDIVKDADPNDPTVAQKFMDSLEGDLTTFKEHGFLTEGGQKWAEAHVDALRQHMMEKTQADMATMAGHAAVVNQQQTVNSLSNTVRSDPSSLDFSIAALKSSTEGMISSSPNLTGVQAASARGEILQKGTESIVKSAAFGYIEKTGQTPPWASDPKYSPYINGMELKQFAQAARYYSHLTQSEERAERAQRDYDNKREFNTQIDKLEAATMPKNAGDKPQLPNDYWDKLRDLATHPGAAIEPGRLKTMVDAGEHITERLNKPEPLAGESHANAVDLLNRIRATDNTRLTSTDEIYNRYGKGGLNNADFKFVMDEYNNVRTPEGNKLNDRIDDFVKSVAPMIDKSNPLMGKIDPSGKEGVYRFQVELKNKIDEYRRASKNPYDLLDPSKPDYMGAPAALENYQKPLQQSIKDTAARLRRTSSVNLTAGDSQVTGVETKELPPVPKRNAGESPDAYLKRLGYK